MSVPAQPPNPEDITPRMPASLLVVTGMSGGGKSVALKTLEDLGFYLSLIHKSEPTSPY